MFKLFTRKNKALTIVPFPGFDIPVKQISSFAFIESLGLFILSIKKEDRVARHKPKDANAFRQWLLDNKIREIKVLGE